MRNARWGIVGASLSLLGAKACLAARDTVVLIGGRKGEGAARHEYPEGVRMLEKLPRESADVKRVRLKVAAFPDVTLP